MDCKVETTEDLDSILQFVTNPDEGIVEFPDHDQEDHFRILVDTKLEAIEALVAEERDFIRGIDDVNENQKQTMKDDLKNDSKKFRNDFIRNISHAIQDLGIISFQVIRPGLADKLRKEEIQRDIKRKLAMFRQNQNLELRQHVRLSKLKQKFTAPFRYSYFPILKVNYMKIVMNPEQPPRKPSANNKSSTKPVKKKKLKLKRV